MALLELSSRTKVDGFKVAAILLILGSAPSFATLLHGYRASMLAWAVTLLRWASARRSWECAGSGHRPSLTTARRAT
jgi:hypothetical protein